MPMMDDQAEQYSPDCAGARATRAIAANSAALDSAAHWMGEAKTWKALWMAEVGRGAHDFEERYSVTELDRARERMDGWSKHPDDNGNITLEYQS